MQPLLPDQEHDVRVFDDCDIAIRWELHTRLTAVRLFVDKGKSACLNAQATVSMALYEDFSSISTCNPQSSMVFEYFPLEKWDEMRQSTFTPAILEKYSCTDVTSSWTWERISEWGRIVPETHSNMDFCVFQLHQRMWDVHKFADSSTSREPVPEHVLT